MTDETLAALRKASKGDALINVASVSFGDSLPHPAGTVAAFEGLKVAQTGLSYSYDGARLRYDGLGGDNRLIGNVYSRRRTNTPPPNMFGGGQIFAEVEGAPEPQGGLRVNLSPAWAEALKGKASPTPKATNLGVAIIPKQLFEEAPGKPFPLDHDLTGSPRTSPTLPDPNAPYPNNRRGNPHSTLSKTCHGVTRLGSRRDAR